MSKTFQLLLNISELESLGRADGVLYRVEPLKFTTLGLKFALLNEAEVLGAEIGQFTGKRASSEIRSVEAQIKVSCSGLVELGPVTGDGHLDALVDSKSETEAGTKNSSQSTKLSDWSDPELHYIHRSVKEYVVKEDVWNEILAQTENENFEPYAALLRSLVMQAKKCPCRGEATSGEGDAWSLAIHSLRIARILENERGTDQLDMINALETALTTRLGLSWWGSHFGDSGESPKWQSNFFTFPVRFGLWRYVHASLQVRSILKPGRPLLHYLCTPQSSVDIHLLGADGRVAEALLQHKADPNEKFGGFSAWQIAWDYSRKSPNSAITLLPVLEVFLKYGADPHTYVEHKRRRVSTRRFSVLKVALDLRTTLRAVYEENGYENTNAESTYVQTLCRIIDELERKGARIREWESVGGVFVLQNNRSWSARRRALREQIKCVVL
ncbi:hypothetical protein K456DRAFT_578986 [Colletotrichum gloeosporioides 23]|nr:hypothetical protein K456DRAFT_578986 [Colletotrichum gloeosporioides 23]